MIDYRKPSSTPVSLYKPRHRANRTTDAPSMVGRPGMLSRVDYVKAGA